MSETAPKPPRSRTAKTLIGCAIGCGSMLVLGMVGCISCVVWLDTPGNVIDPEALLAGDTTGYVEWTVDLDDPGTDELMQSFMQSLQRAQQEGVPDSGPGRIISQFQAWSNKSTERDLRKAFPLVVAGCLRSVGASKDGFVLTGSLRGADHQLVFLDLIGGFFVRRWGDADTFRYRGETVLVVPSGGDHEPFGLFIRGGDAFFASSADQARYAVDLLTGSAPEGVPAIDRWFSTVPDTPLRGAVTNGGGEVRRLWESFSDDTIDEAIPDEVWSSVEGVVVSGGFDGAGVFSIHIELDIIDSARAAVAAEPVRGSLERNLAGSLFHVSEVAALGDRLRVKLATEPLVEQFEKLEELEKLR